MKGLLPLAAFAIAVPALAQMPGMPGMGHGPVCTRPVIVPGFEAWGKASGPTLAIGRTATLKLPDATTVNFSPELTRPAQTGSFGGVFPLKIVKAGTYRLALAGPAWIDVILDGAKQTPVAHMHGPMCSGIAKIVDFTLRPGDYQVQLSELKSPTIQAMVVAK